MKEMTLLSNLNRIDKPTYMVSLPDFIQDTDAEDGAVLLVIDEASHAVNNYYVAFNGQWHEL